MYLRRYIEHGGLEHGDVVVQADRHGDDHLRGGGEEDGAGRRGRCSPLPLMQPVLDVERKDHALRGEGVWKREGRV